MEMGSCCVACKLVTMFSREDFWTDLLIAALYLRANGRGVEQKL